MSNDGATQAVARFIRGTTFASIPEPVRESARRTIADTVAVFLAGSGGDVVPHLREYLKRNPSPGAAPVIGWGTSVTPEVAAMVNGALGHALDYDEVTTLYPAHPSVPILSALLASQEPASLDGESLLVAYVTGFEVGGQIARGAGTRRGRSRSSPPSPPSRRPATFPRTRSAPPSASLPPSPPACSGTSAR
jgi:2-methylcitrate dehydratase PrpD